MLSRSPLDRAEELRKDSAALTAGWPTASVLRVDPVGRVPVTDGAVGMVPAAEVADAPPSDAVFLGRADGRHLWAIPVESLDGETTDLRSFGDVLTESSAGVVVTAVALLNWHRSARFSARDGSPTRMSAAGWSRVSEATGHEEWPRSDPAIIVLVHDGADRVLLARQPTWPERRMSVLAGFVEAGESLESCVVREVREEVGLDVTGIEYLGSQPWPFPRSIMIGFAARADPDAALAFTDGEIAEARWFHRSDVEAALAAGDWAASTSAPLLLPGSISIARAMLESWVARP
ncbi:NAD(+) diphosphatase [Rhodococcoides corynebacterioides]|uniref:NAD(+) diphosphatase n=1 Tax=Rhodococcoides corynebacterioides TaxID=53972 RepID=UPI001C9AF970|nr:NAD(+) diphosphatase [Rhodococcus corynebacterioides]MBY6363639.1 NAD(+) diphosphatase [Rhodococcus corynebacterioides]